MSEPFIGEIRIMPYMFAPLDWAYCNGQEVLVSQYQALYAVIGNQFGGSGATSFNLPDLRDRVPVGAGQGPGLSIPWSVGMRGGESDVTLTTAQLPRHNHLVNADSSDGAVTDPAGATFASANKQGRKGPVPVNLYADATDSFAANMTTSTGGNLPHENRQPYLGVNFCIAMTGLFPARP